MDTSHEWRLHGSHLPTAVKEDLADSLIEIEAATNAFLEAASDFAGHPSDENAERVWMSSRFAWSLLLPYRTQVIEANRPIAEKFLGAIQTLRRFLATHEIPQDDVFRHLLADLTHRESLLDALLALNGEPRIRELLTATR